MSTPDAAFALPVGTVTFLLTDVAGSTRMWEDEDDGAMRAAVVRHYEILAEAVDAHGGVRPQEQGEGDSIVAAFARPSDALAAASAAQVALAAESWPTSTPVRVRMAIHTGEAQLRDDANYAGQAIIRTARLRAIGHGGQVLVSGATRDLAVDQTGATHELRSLGEHRLRDLGRPEHVWQLVVPGASDDFADLLSLDSIPNTLPVSLSPFIGRSGEIRDLAGLVGRERLVTATGTGGAGKTRLAQQVGAEVIHRFPAGVWWVELAALDGEGVEPAVRAAFGVSEGAVTPLPEAVRRRLDGRPSLLIVDNCEHVTSVVAPLLDDLLHAAPTLHVLATSRVMLDLPGEQAWRVPALALPEPGAVLPLDALSQFDAVRLFCDRARRARPNFELTITNGPSVAEICHRLGGIPLAIELAAARTRMLDPQRILEGLDDAFRILTGGSRSVMPRQQTLDASIAWSFDLLAPAERALLRRLSVFVDGWALDAAEAVGADPDDADTTLDRYAVFDALDRLVDHSLVHTSDTAAGLRFGMLETVRQYALRQLAANPAEQLAAQLRHCHHYTDWVISCRDEALLGLSDAKLDEIAAERSNILRATEHAIATGDAGRALDALTSLAPILDLGAWVPHASNIVLQLDRLEEVAAREDEWRVLLVRQRTMALRGDPMGELDVLDRMVRRAEAADQPLGAALGRSTHLLILSTAGMPVFDEARRAVAELEVHDATWARFEWFRLAFMAAYQGQLVLAEEVIAAQCTSGSRVDARVLDLIHGLIAFVRGDAAVCRASMETTLASSAYVPRGVLTVAEAFLAFAGADLGIDLTDAPERRCRRSWEVDGNQLGSATADGLLAVRHLLDDDAESANRLLRRATDTGIALGIPGGWPNERAALVALGHDDYEDVIGLTGGNLADVANHRARAEQHLRRGDLATALEEVTTSISIAVPNRA